jgi:PAS domain S-box-containing protein
VHRQKKNGQIPEPHGSASHEGSRDLLPYQHDSVDKSERKYRDLAETASIALHWVGVDGTILWANQAELDLLGYTREEYLGHKITEFHVDGPVIDDILNRLCRGERLQEYEARLRAKDGSIRHVVINSSVLFENGKFVHTRCFTRDVSERKRAEQALRESEQRLRVVTDATPVMIWMSGTDKLCYYFNKTWLEFVGRTLEQEMGNGWAENVHPDDFDRCLQIYVTCFDDRQPFEMQYRLRHHSGQYRWILDHGVPRHTPDGTFEGYVGGCLDIHDQKEAAEKVRIASEALRESEERLRLAQHAAGIGTFELNIQTKVNRWTPELEAMYGLDPGAFDGTQEHWERLIHPDDRPAVLKQVEVALRSGAPVQAEWRVIWPNGAAHWILGRWQVFRDDSGMPLRMAGINIDVTKQKVAEEAMRRLAAIVESSDDAIISKDLDGIITSWNRQAERLFGYKEEEIVGRSVLTIIPPELHRDEEMILNQIRSGQKIDHFETVRLTKAGERMEVSLSISPVRDEHGRVVGAAKITRDIRENKRIERTLRTTEKLAAAGRLAATVAHEINNPLEAVANLIYLAKRDLPDASKVAAHLSAAKGELNRVVHIARQTLGFYRDTSSPVRVNVQQALDDLLTLYQRRMDTRNIQIIRECDNHAEIIALGGEMRQAFSNVLTNAIDAMPSGGILRVRVRKTQDWSSRRVPGVRVTIADSGTGIAQVHRCSVFQPFFTTKTDVGTGLGLWITRGIVEKHNGIIRLKSQTGSNHGTTFCIFLPLGTKSTTDNQPRAEIKAGLAMAEASRE